MSAGSVETMQNLIKTAPDLLEAGKQRETCDTHSDSVITQQNDMSTLHVQNLSNVENIQDNNRQHKKTQGSISLNCSDLETNKLPKKQLTLPTPLNIPKRFSKVQSTDKKLDRTEQPIDKEQIIDNIQQITNNNQYIQPLQPLQHLLPLQPMSQIPNQQMFYNVQTGTIMTLPVLAQSYPYQASPQIVMAPPRDQQLPTQQIVYMRTITGQLVPVLTPTTSCPISVNNQHLRQNISPTTKERSDSASPTVKRQKTLNLAASSSSATKVAEHLQKQQIQLQKQMHPNLNEEFGTTNISDIYETNKKCNSTVGNNINTNSTTTASATINSAISNSTEDAFDDETSSTLEKNDPELAESINLLVTAPNKIIGSVTLGTFTYKYSQTLSGNLARDKELFDRLTENAWKSCLFKQQ
jgi:hypothetical protein